MSREQKIKRLLRALGAGGTYKGFDYFTKGILWVMNDRTCIQYITKDLYMDLSIEYKKSWKRIEGAMRTVINQIWEHGDRELLEEIAGRKLRKQPKNVSFMEMLADYLEMEEEAAVTAELDADQKNDRK